MSTPRLNPAFAAVLEPFGGGAEDFFLAAGLYHADKVTDEAETLKGWKFRLIRRMYERGYEQTLILELFRLIDWMIRLPKGLEADFRRELYAYEEQRRMPYVTTVEQAGIEKGLQQGEARTLLR